MTRFIPVLTALLLLGSIVASGAVISVGDQPPLSLNGSSSIFGSGSSPQPLTIITDNANSFLSLDFSSATLSQNGQPVLFDDWINNPEAFHCVVIEFGEPSGLVIHEPGVFLIGDFNRDAFLFPGAGTSNEVFFGQGGTPIPEPENLTLFLLAAFTALHRRSRQAK